MEMTTFKPAPSVGVKEAESATSSPTPKGEGPGQAGRPPRREGRGRKGAGYYGPDLLRRRQVAVLLLQAHPPSRCFPGGVLGWEEVEHHPFS